MNQESREILAAAEQADAEEDARWGGKRGDELSEELARRESRLARIRQAKKALAERARERAAEAGEPDEEAQKASPRDKDQYNFTDPESRIMKVGGGFEQAYNAQAAVEHDLEVLSHCLTHHADNVRVVQRAQAPANAHLSQNVLDNVFWRNIFLTTPIFSVKLHPVLNCGGSYDGWRSRNKGAANVEWSVPLPEHAAPRAQAESWFFS